MKLRTVIISAALLLSSCFSALSASADDDIQSFINRANRQYGLKLYEQSIGSATRAINLGTSDFTPYMIRGMSMRALNYHKQALPDLIAAARLTKKPLPIDCYVAMSECYVMRNDLKNALAELNQADSFYSKSGDVSDLLRHRIQIYCVMRNYKGALDDSNRLTELYGSQGPWTFALRAKIQKQFAHYNEALADYSKVIKMAPDVSTYYAERAQVYLKLGKPSLAEIDRKKAEELAQSHGGAHHPS
jgi:tetratricopeptide (TPR) repeat protein